MEYSEKYDIYTDFEILCSKLSKKTWKKLSKQYKKNDSINRFKVILSIFQQNAEAFINNQSSFTFHDGICLLRNAIRVSNLINDINWLNKIKTNDIICISNQLFISTKLSIEEQWKRQEILLNSFDYSTDPEQETAEISKLLIIMGYYNNFGKFDEIPTLIEKGTKLYNDNPNDRLLKYNYCNMLNFYTWILREKGKIEKAKINMFKAMKIIKQLRSQSLKVFNSNIAGAFYMHIGETEKAIEAFQISKNIREDWDDKRGIYVLLTNIGAYLTYCGEFIKAIDYLEKANQLGSKLFKKQIVGPYNFTASLTNLAEVYLYTGELDKAYDNITKANELLNPIQKTTYGYSEVKKNLVEILIERGDYRSAEIVLNELHEIISEKEFDPIITGYYYGLGRLKSHEKKVYEAHKAFIVALKYAIQTQDFNFQLKIQLRLAQLYFQEFGETYDIKALINVNKFIDNIILASKEQNFSYLLCRCLILKANVEQFQNNFLKALEILEEGLRFSKELKIERQIILEKIDKLKKILQENGVKENHQSLLEDSFLQLRNSFNFSFNRNLIVIPFKIYGIMIVDRSGLPVYSHFLEEELKKSDILISGLISAINTLASQILNQAEIGELKTIKHENIEILLEKQEDRLIVLITDQDTFELRNSMLQFNLQAKIIKPNELLNNIDAKKEELDVLFSDVFKNK
jgi:tetratricopeptide (TPR) repeat protein